MPTKEIVEAGSGNVFADLGYPNAKELKLKVRLAIEVSDVLKQRRLSRAKAAKLLGIRESQLSALIRFRLDGFSVDRLKGFLTRLWPGSVPESPATPAPASPACRSD